MASSLSKSFTLFFLSLALLCCFTFADLIDDVCRGTRNPSLCSKSLRSDPRSRGADLKLLGQISIDLATKSAKSGVTLVTNLKNAAKDPKLKGIYDTCLETYDDSVDSLFESSVDLKNGDFLGMNLQASAAETDIDTCDESFTEAHVAEPAQLKAASQNIQDLCGIILVISNRLRG
jgi:pectinesterase inhibitor-like protein